MKTELESQFEPGMTCRTEKGTVVLLMRPVSELTASGRDWLVEVPKHNNMAASVNENVLTIVDEAIKIDDIEPDMSERKQAEPKPPPKKEPAKEPKESKAKKPADAAESKPPLKEEPAKRPGRPKESKAKKPDGAAEVGKRGKPATGKTPFALMRKESGLSQSEIAERVGIKQPIISMLERGAKSPSKSQATACAEELGFDVVSVFPGFDSLKD